MPDPQKERPVISVFPNSGHHNTFVPFTSDLLVKFPELRQLCAAERTPWRDLNHSWVRGRLATRDGQPGLWVAVESNLGTIRRGSVHEPRRQAPDGTGNPENPSPYAAADPARLPGETNIHLSIPSRQNPAVPIEIEFTLIWKEPAGEPIDVDLVVDFGNTRTVVLALENQQSQDGKLASICKSVRFTRRGFDYEAFKPEPGRPPDDTAAIVDSWFVLQEPLFSNLEPPSPKFVPALETDVQEEPGGFLRAGTRKTFVTARVPQMFVELSHVVMGESARQILGLLDLNEGGNYSLSSPKRYAWDTDLTGRDANAWWTMVLNRWNAESRTRAALPKLAGSVLRFMPTDGRDWPIDAPANEATEKSQRPPPNPEQPTYPRSDAMCWAALAILELAHRQITSEEWRKGNNPFIPRRLRNILVTFPSGWSGEETRVYQDKWQKAINIFALAHLRDKRSVTEGGDRPLLLMDLDEAVASQLPFVFSEIRRLGNIGENWIELFGRGQGTAARVRLMTVDIGGGTTDVSIVEYCDTHEGGGVNLEATLLFRDSSSVAGDALTKEIIECVLLPTLGEAYRDEGDVQTRFENFFNAAFQTAAEKAKWSRVVKLVFIPMVRQWLKDLSENRYGSPETGAGWSPDRIMGAEGPLVDRTALDELNAFFAATGLGDHLMEASTPVNYDPEQVKACITRTFGPVINSLAKFVTAFEVDLVTLSGKPSELPQVKEMLEDLLPVLPQRIVQAKGFPAGDWYPLSTDNRVADAKSVTAVGAALYQAIKNGLINGWNIQRRSSEHITPRNYWGAMPVKNRPYQFSQLFLKPDEDEKACKVQIGTQVGRKLLPSAARPEPVYKFRWRDAGRFMGVHHNALLDVRLERVPADVPGEAESLRLLEVTGTVGGRAITADDVELKLCTLEEGEYWIDSGRFEVVWP